jgi:hypothetical protein
MAFSSEHHASHAGLTSGYTDAQNRRRQSGRRSAAKLPAKPCQFGLPVENALDAPFNNVARPLIRDDSFSNEFLWAGDGI